MLAETLTYYERQPIWDESNKLLGFFSQPIDGNLSSLKEDCIYHMIKEKEPTGSFFKKKKKNVRIIYVSLF